MALNTRVSYYANRVVEKSAYGFEHFIYIQAKREYYEVLKEEIKKNKSDAWGWLAYEDPTDSLVECIIDEARPDYTNEVLTNYNLFYDIVEEIYPEHKRDKELCKKVESYIKNGITMTEEALLTHQLVSVVNPV